MSEWFEATVLGTRPAGAGLTELDLDVGGTPVEGAHRRPGQYLKLKAPAGGESFFAIASPPGGDPRRLELLIKGGAAVADALVALAAGARVMVSAVQGRGFPVEEAHGKDVLLFATGSGISPLRSLIGVLARERDRFKKITLYFGARTPDAFAYADEVEDWRQAGIDVIQTVSQPGDSGWAGLTGYVQSHVPPVPMDHAVAFVCGQRQMVHGVTEALAARGLPKGRVFLNY